MVGINARNELFAATRREWSRRESICVFALLGKYKAVAAVQLAANRCPLDICI